MGIDVLDHGVNGRQTQVGRALKGSVLCCAATCLIALTSPIPADEPTQRAQIPELTLVAPRPEKAISGAEFARSTSKMSGRQRQARALDELRSGNIPAFLRRLQPVEVQHIKAGDTLRAVLWVTPDYLAIGSDSDFLRIPLTYPSAVTIASEFGCLLPTRKIVDAIYAQATVHLAPIPMKPGARMRSSEYYLKHQRMIQEQLGGRQPDSLIAGNKKDVVISNRLYRKKGRIAIYGWHRPSGRPIQPLSTVHEARYADYSHGIRLVLATVWINDQPHSLYDALQDPLLAPLFTYEVRIEKPRRLMEWRTGGAP